MAVVRSAHQFWQVSTHTWLYQVFSWVALPLPDHTSPYLRPLVRLWWKATVGRALDYFEKLVKFKYFNDHLKDWRARSSQNAARKKNRRVSVTFCQRTSSDQTKNRILCFSEKGTFVRVDFGLFIDCGPKEEKEEPWPKQALWGIKFFCGRCQKHSSSTEFLNKNTHRQQDPQVAWSLKFYVFSSIREFVC